MVDYNQFAWEENDDDLTPLEVAYILSAWPLKYDHDDDVDDDHYDDDDDDILHLLMYNQSDSLSPLRCTPGNVPRKEDCIQVVED